MLFRHLMMWAGGLPAVVQALVFRSSLFSRTFELRVRVQNLRVKG